MEQVEKLSSHANKPIINANKAYRNIAGADTGLKNLAVVSISYYNVDDVIYDRETNYKLSSIKHFRDRKLKEFEKQRNHFVGSFKQHELQEMQSYEGYIPTPGRNIDEYISSISIN